MSNKLPNEARRSSAEWRGADAAHLLHPFSDSAELASNGVRVIERAEGIHIWDTEGHRILDGMSGLWCVNLGYGQSALIDAATRQLQRLPFYNAFFQTSTPPAIALAEALAEVAPEGFSRVFFTGSGSEGNDTVVRMIHRYWALQGQPQRRVIISRHNAYHGSTIAGASLGGMAGMHAQLGAGGGPLLPDIEHIGQPDPWEHRGPDGSFPADFGLTAARWLEDRIQAVGPERVAAFIAEPVQGAGGVIVPPGDYWPEVQRICRRHGILIASDEVICGFGRTGQWWGCQTLGYEPDLITFAKGVTSGYVPLGGVLVGRRVAETVFDRGGEFEHGYTYSGHPVACAVGLANLKLMQELDVVRRVREELAPRLAQGLAGLASHPLVGGVQQQGMMASLMLVRDKARRERFPAEQAVGLLCRKHCFDTGIVMRAVGHRMVIAPPLVITLAQVDEMVDLMKRSLDHTLADVQARGWL
jgi:putrescine aminotransferase